MNVFDAWLIIVGLAIGAGLAWLVMLDLRRRDDDISARESRDEAAWIADTLRSREIAADAEAVEEVLRLHRAYLAGIPDDGGQRRASEPTFAFEDADDEPLDEMVEAAPAAPAAPAWAPPAAAPAAKPPAVPAPTAPAPVAPAPAAVAAEEPAPSGEGLEPAWADEDLEAAHEALEALLNKAPPED